GLHIRSPSEDRLASGRCLIKTADACRMRGVLYEIRIFFCLAVDIDHRFDEGVEIRTAYRFRRLDQHRALDNEREVDRHRVKSVIDQALCDIKRYDTILRLILVRKDRLVHTIGWEGLCERSFEFVAKIAGVKYGRLCRFFEAIIPVRVDVGKCTNHHSEIAVESLYSADRIRIV